MSELRHAQKVRFLDGLHAVVDIRMQLLQVVASIRFAPLQELNDE